MEAKQKIGGAVKAAQDFEENKQEREAYQYYLYAVEEIVKELRNVSPPGSTSSCGIPPGTLFSFASVCLESAQQLLKKATEEKRDFTTSQIVQQSMPATINRSNNVTTAPATINTSNNVTTAPATINRSSTLPHYQSPQRMMSDVTGASSSTSLPVRHHSLSDPSERNVAFKRKPQVTRSNKAQYNVQPLHRISPMDEAKRKNMYLMQQYKASLRKDSVKILGPQRQNLTLNYLRRMEENRSVARLNEQALARKTREREARLRQENQRVKLTTFRKSMDSLSVEDLVAEVTLFEQGKTNFQSIRQRLSNSPDSTDVVVELVNEVLSSCDHPLSKLLGECQFSITQFLQPLARKIESAGRLPFCNTTKDPTGNHNLRATLSMSSFSPENTNGDNSPDCSEATQQSLDQKLSALKDELVNIDNVDNNDSNTQTATDPKSTFNGETFSRQQEDSDDDDEYFTMQSIDDPYLPDIDEDNDDGPFETLKEKTNEIFDPVLDLAASPQTQEQTIIFKGLVHVLCEPQYGVQSSFNKLSNECSGYLGGAVKLIRSAIDKMVKSFAKVYPEIKIDDNNDECRNVVEENFFPAIVPLLLPVYRASNYSDECTILKNMAEHCNDTPKEAGVRRKFWLENQDTPPYSNAIAILHDVCKAQTPRTKLEHLVTFSKSIIQSIEDYYDSCETKVDTGVGVDDILPVMSYIIIKSAQPELISECSFMQDFIQECYSMGEEGFCLTSFDTAVKFVTKMNP